MIINCGKIENLSIEHDIELWWGWGGVALEYRRIRGVVAASS